MTGSCGRSRSTGFTVAQTAAAAGLFDQIIKGRSSDTQVSRATILTSPVGQCGRRQDRTSRRARCAEIAEGSHAAAWQSSHPYPKQATVQGERKRHAACLHDSLAAEFDAGEPAQLGVVRMSRCSARIQFIAWPGAEAWRHSSR